MAKIETRLKKIARFNRKKKWCMNNLESKKGLFQKAVENEIMKKKDCEVRGVDKEWCQLKEAMTIGAK